MDDKDKNDQAASDQSKDKPQNTGTAPEANEKRDAEISRLAGEVETLKTANADLAERLDKRDADIAEALSKFEQRIEDANDRLQKAFDAGADAPVAERLPAVDPNRASDEEIYAEGNFPEMSKAVPVQRAPRVNRQLATA